MRVLFICCIVLLSTALDAGKNARTQPYCAMYSDDSKSCGMPSLQSCEQSIRGMGGYCTPDLTSQMQPDLLRVPPPQQSFDPAYHPPSAPLQLPTPGRPYSLPPPGTPATGSAQTSPNLDWMPPPPGQ